MYNIDMYYLYALFGGIFITLMISTNGTLSSAIGLYSASLLIRILGTVFSYFMAKVHHQENIVFKKIPLILYFGGTIGALSTLFNNYAFAHMNVTSIMAISLFTESTYSLIIDANGWFNTTKRPIQKSTIACLCCSFIGILILLSGFTSKTWFAVFITILSGIAVVLSRMFNVRLAQICGNYGGSFFNQTMGIPMFLCLLLCFGFKETANYSLSLLTSIPLYAYAGGAFGVIIVYLTNQAIQKISAYQVSLFSFIGQIFSGIFIDILLQNNISYQTLIGGIFILIGLSCYKIIKK